MIKNIAICGDSFSAGIGVHDLTNDPYGSLLGKELDATVFNLAKGSSSNFSIMLQVKHILANNSEIDFVCVSATSYNRTEWMPDTCTDLDTPLTNFDVNYHQYPPFGKDSYVYQGTSPMTKHPEYDGKMITEHYGALFDYLDNHLGKSHNYYSRLTKERVEKLKLIRDYYLNVYDERIKAEYDRGLVLMAHTLLKKRGIKHVILSKDWNFDNLIDDENLVKVDWFELSTKYPDDVGTMHTSKEGHQVALQAVLDKIDANKWR